MGSSIGVEGGDGQGREKRKMVKFGRELGRDQWEGRGEGKTHAS